ncbi:hypothetical protein [Pseudogemmobacter blasticus]|uniref:hypothetical protein n=1 Tax=Fuscovulum blasticum TaxID=1075 RepID=UPI001D17270A|nr:hypothetical protein [Fuscovulum blasticum]
MALRHLFPALMVVGLAACGRNDLAEPPMPLGEFALGLNIVVADKVEMVPISRPATPAEWEAAMTKAVADRFGRYQGTKLYNIGISVDGYALAPPGIPVVAAPKSVLVITANIWDDAARKKLNEEGKQFTVFEGLSGESVIGTGITRNKKQQMEALSYNAAKKVEDWLVQNPQWFGMTPEQMDAAIAARAVTVKSDAKAAAAAKKAAAAAAPAAAPQTGHSGN